MDARGEPLPDAGSDPKTNGDLSADIRRLEGADRLRAAGQNRQTPSDEP